MSDRLALANAIEDAGIERAKAERVASVIFDVIRDNVATKADVQASEARLRGGLLLIVARWMLGIEGGAFDSMKGEIEPSKRADVERQFARLRALIEKVERGDAA